MNRHETHCNIPIYSAFGQTLECIGENKCEVFLKYLAKTYLCIRKGKEIKEKNNGKKSKGVS